MTNNRIKEKLKREQELNRAFERIMNEHRGATNPITAAEIADRLGIKNGLGSREAREFIKSKIEDLYLPIGAHEGGYYIIETEEELNAYLENLQGRYKSIAARMAMVKENYQRAQKLDQDVMGDDEALELRRFLRRAAREWAQ